MNTQYKSLNQKYTYSVLEFLLEKDKIMITELLEIVKNYPTLKNLISLMERDGLVKVDEKKLGRKIIMIELTEKGRKIAEGFNKITSEEAIVFDENEYNSTYETLSLCEKISTYNDHILISEKKDDEEKNFKILINLDDKVKSLYCNPCESTNCIHVNYAWSLKKIRDMIFEKKVT